MNPNKNIIRTGILLIIITLAGFYSFAQPGWGRHYAYRPAYYHGPRVYSVGHPYVSIGFRGLNYAYYGGYFYRPFPGYFRMVAPPIGIGITILPPGYQRIDVGQYPYFYFNGIYYAPSPGNTYTVVSPPLGAQVNNLPPDTHVMVIDGQKYYEYNGTYYRENVSSDNQRSYTVVGTDGVLNTDSDGPAPVTPAGPRIGDRMDKLPDNCREITINGTTYYEAPSGYYYQEVIEKNTISYEVVGKSSDQQDK
jgi:hypothetical protein